MRLLTKFICVFVWMPLLCFGAKTVADAFSLPEGSVVLNRDDSGKTWNLNGMFTNNVATARSSLTNEIAKAGWKLKHDIDLDRESKSVLSLWTIKTKELTVMTWHDQKNKRFYFSYGVTGK